MSEANFQGQALSHKQGHDELVKLRVALLQRVQLLHEHSEAYYYLCGVLEKAPSFLSESLRAVVDQQAQCYVEHWQGIIDISRRADLVLEQLARQVDVERQLNELETETAGE